MYVYIKGKKNIILKVIHSSFHSECNTSIVWQYYLNCGSTCVLIFMFIHGKKHNN